MVEDWGEFVIIHSNFGSLINRALAQLLGEVLSDKLGRGIVVQHDPYRIFVQTMGSMSAERLVEVFNEFKDMSRQTAKEHVNKINSEDWIIQTTRNSGCKAFWCTQEVGRL